MKSITKKVWLSSLVVFFLTFTPNKVCAKSAEEWYQKALDHADTEPQIAIHAYLKALELKPNWAEAHHGLAVIYFQTDDGVRAIDQLRKAKFYYQQRTDLQAAKNLAIVKNNLKKAYQNLQLDPKDFNQLSGFVNEVAKQKPSTEQMGAEIFVRLSGNDKFPGELSLHNGGKNIEHLCFIGSQGRGLVDKKFLKILSNLRIPEGEYTVSAPRSDEEWPTSTFSANGALRLKPVTEPAVSILHETNKTGIAIHGRDFYPLLENRVKKKKMIDFFNHLLFERLGIHWGPLGISNWDMGRLHDFWKRNTNTPEQWKATVTAIKADEIRKICRPPDAKRKLD